MKRTTSTMPSKKAIKDYWELKNPDLFFKNIDWSLHDDNEYDDLVHVMGKNPNKIYHCFACGFSHLIERAHIIAHCEGGSDEVDNIHLLCKTCHRQSEGRVKPNDKLSRIIYDEWLMNKNHYRDSLEKAKREGIKKYTDHTPVDEQKRDMLKKLKLSGMDNELIEKTMVNCFG